MPRNLVRPDAACPAPPVTLGSVTLIIKQCDTHTLKECDTHTSKQCDTHTLKECDTHTSNKRECVDVIYARVIQMETSVH